MEADKDYSSITDENIPLAIEMAKTNGKFHEAIELLLQLEKLTRQGSDIKSLGNVLVAIVQVCYENSHWDTLIEYIPILIKKRSQQKDAVSKMIQKCVTYIELIPDKDIKTNLIKTIRTVTEGKIYVEVERARLTKMLAELQEIQGDLDGACDIMKDLQVESYGGMDRREKAEFILEQIRLFQLKQNIDFCQILVKKIPLQFLNEPKQEDLKLKFYKLRILLDQDTNFFQTSLHYQSVLNLKIFDSNQKQIIMKKAILYCILSQFSNEQQNMMYNLSKNTILEDIPIFKKLLIIFSTKELIGIESFHQFYNEILWKIICDQNKVDEKCYWTELKDRVVEHNIRIISGYYTRIYLNRLAELLDISEDDCETYITKLVNSGIISAKIDRTLGFVNFQEKKEINDILNDCLVNMNKFMKLVNNVSHCINNEECIHNVSTS